MLFSIIIPVYNVEKYLGDCLDSVLNQSFSDWEAICIDDGSTDGSSVILDKYAASDSRIKVVTQKNAGTSAARNTGLQTAEGEYIFFLDSDDWLETDALYILSSRLNGEDILCFNGRRYFESTETYNKADCLPEKTYQSGIDYYNENALLPRDFAFVCVVLRVYKRAFLLRYNLFFANDVSYEDNLWVPITLYYAQNVSIIPDSLYLYRIHQGSKMQGVSLTRKNDLLKVANRLAAFFVPKQGIDKRIIYRAITHHYQAVMTNAPRSLRKDLNKQCNWSLYYKVSQTKFRHRMNFIKNRISSLF